MAKRKPARRKSDRWVTQAKRVSLILGGITALLGGVWGLDQHWTPRELYSGGMEQMQRGLQSLQREIKIQSMRDEVFYWLRREKELKAECARNPRSQALKEEYQEAVTERRNAERRLYQEQGK